jgi:hypothetical protein
VNATKASLALILFVFMCALKLFWLSIMRGPIGSYGRRIALEVVVGRALANTP